MKFSIDRQSLITPLSTVASIIKGGDKPILSHVLIEIADGKMKVTGANNEMEMTATLDVDASIRTDFTVPAKKLLDIVRSGNSEQVTFTLEDNHAKVQLGRGRFTLPLLPTEHYPTLDVDLNNTQTVTISPEVLSNALKATSFSMAKDDARYFLNGMRVEFEKDLFRTVATDGHRLSFHEYKKVGDEDYQGLNGSMAIILPRNFVQKLSTLLKGEKLSLDLNISNNSISVDFGSLVVKSKLIDGRYPDYNRVIPKGKLFAFELNTHEMIDVVKRANILSDKPMGRLQCAFNKDSVELSLTEQQNVLSSEDMPCKLLESDKDEPVQVALNINYLLETISSIPTSELILNLVDSQSPVEILPIKTEERSNITTRYIIMPMR